jgi:hypothetical protein
VPIEAYVDGDTLHVGVTDVVDPSLQAAVAVYVPLLLSLTDDGPEIDREDNVAATFTIVTARDAVRVTPPLV